MEGSRIECATLISKNNETIQHCIYNKLGVNTRLDAVVHDKTVVVTDILKTDVSSKLQGNKLLRHMFTGGELIGYAWMEEETKIISIRLNIMYTHPIGSNGLELGTIRFYPKKNKCQFIPVK